MTKISKISLERVHYMPRELEPGILYVSEEFGAAAHLCACGCGTKVRTPLGPTEWSLQATPEGPTLFPSVGNWQQSCQSHYIIRNGRIIWAKQWTPNQIAAGRAAEEAHRKAYYDALYSKKHRRTLTRIWEWIKHLFR